MRVIGLGSALYRIMGRELHRLGGMPRVSASPVVRRGLILYSEERLDPGHGLGSGFRFGLGLVWAGAGARVLARAS